MEAFRESTDEPVISANNVGWSQAQFSLAMIIVSNVIALLMFITILAGIDEVRDAWQAQTITCMQKPGKQ